MRIEPWDLSNVFYATRQDLDELGYNVDDLSEDKTRRRIHGYVKDVCNNIGIKRHEIGIYPDERAVLTFRGNSYPVGYDDIDKLAWWGQDVVCVEKYSFVQKTSNYMEKFGIAYLQSKGFMVEYGEMLASKAAEKFANVSIITDFDSSGIILAFNVENVARIGVDFNTVAEINKILVSEKKPKIDPWKLVERYSGGGTHYQSLEYLFEKRWQRELLRGNKNRRRISRNRSTGECKPKYPSWWNSEHHRKYQTYLMQEFEGETYLDIIKTRRMEINAIMNVVGGEIFSKWLRKKLVEEFHNRYYYPRSIFVDNFVLTPTIIEFNKRIDKFATDQLKNLVEASREKLVNVKGHVIDVNKKEAKIKKAMVLHLMDDIKTLYLQSALRDFMDQHLPV